MPTLFTRIITGELPGRFVWRDERCVAFLSINPLRAGHTLVVPINEVDHWTDLTPDLAAHLMTVAQTIGRAQLQAFQTLRVGLVIAGLEVPHCHLHVLPINEMADLDFANARADVPAQEFDAAAAALRQALRDLGESDAVAD